MIRLLNFQTIIVGYDDSENSRHALEKALSFSTTDTKIILAHADEEVIENSYSATEKNPQLRSNNMIVEGMQIQPLHISNHAEEKTTHSTVINSVDQAITHAKQLADDAGKKLEIKILGGKPADAICELAEELKADIIFVGSSSKEGLKRIFLGSNSEKITKEAPCSVMVVK